MKKTSFPLQIVHKITQNTQKPTQIKRKIKKSEKNGASAPFFSLVLIFLLIWVCFLGRFGFLGEKKVF